MAVAKIRLYLVLKSTENQNKIILHEWMINQIIEDLKIKNFYILGCQCKYELHVLILFVFTKGIVSGHCINTLAEENLATRC